MENKKSNDGKYWLIAVVMFFLGAGGLYLLMYFFPEPFIKTVSEQVETRNVSIVDNGISEAVDKIYDAVVVVKTYQKKQLYATGTGFVYKTDDNNAYILTNNHVIEKGDSIFVEFTNGNLVETKVAGKDAYSDIAVLSVSKKEADKVASIGSSENAKIGDTVFSVGAPLDADSYSGTVTRGILSGKNRLVGVSLSNSTTNDMMMSVLQTDAAINSGNSGGPLVNANGEVIGITSLKLASTGVEGMGFAIPIETAMNFAEKLEKGETIKRPLLGITMRNLAEAQYLYYPRYNDLDITNGVFVEDVNSDSPADKAGLKDGDIITEMDGKEVTSIAYLRYLLFNHNVGDSIKVKVLRGSDTLEITINLTESV